MLRLTRVEQKREWNILPDAAPGDLGLDCSLFLLSGLGETDLRATELRKTEREMEILILFEKHLLGQCIYNL